MRVLIIDDERNGREIIKLKGNLKAFGFTDILEASNGEDAMAIIRKVSPELIITDMNMPIMDGVSLLTQLNNSKEDYKIIVISGYTDFHYTKKAIQSKVIDYLLKPLKKEELYAAIKKALHLIGSDKEPGATSPRINREICEPNDSLLDKSLNRLNCCWESNNIVMIYLKLLNFEEIKNQLFSKYTELMCYSIEENIAHFFRDKNLDISTMPIPNLFSDFIIFIRDDSSKSNYYKICNELQGHLNTTFDLTCLITLTSYEHSLAPLNKSYRELKNTLYNMHLSLTEPIIVGHEETSLNTVGDCTLDIGLNNLEELLKSNDEKLLTSYIYTFYDDLVDRHSTSINNLNLICIEFLNILSSWYKHKKLDMDSIINEDKRLLFTYYAGDIENLKKWMIDLLTISLRYLNDHKRYNCCEPLSKILHYIEDHFNEKIDLELLSQEFYLSKGHISRLFKKELDITFIDFLNSIRMKKAIYLLINTDQKLLTICGEVGYNDVSYFSRLFKKYYGVPPQEYRLNHSI